MSHTACIHCNANAIYSLSGVPTCATCGKPQRKVAVTRDYDELDHPQRYESERWEEAHERSKGEWA